MQTISYIFLIGITCAFQNSMEGQASSDWIYLMGSISQTAFENNPRPQALANQCFIQKYGQGQIDQLLQANFSASWRGEISPNVKRCISSGHQVSLRSPFWWKYIGPLPQ